MLAEPANDVYKHVADTIGKVPGARPGLRRAARAALSFMTAGLVLAVMMIPIVTAVSREVLATVSQDDKNAALAMGATRWEMLRACVFPRARSGLVGAVMLGMGRALGETIAVALVIGANARITSHIFQPGETAWRRSSRTSSAKRRANRSTASALIGLAVLLFVFTLIVNVAGPLVSPAAPIGGRRCDDHDVARRPTPPPEELESWIGGAPTSTAPPRRRTCSRRSGWSAR